MLIIAVKEGLEELKERMIKRRRRMEERRKRTVRSYKEEEGMELMGNGIWRGRRMWIIEVKEGLEELKERMLYRRRRKEERRKRIVRRYEEEEGEESMGNGKLGQRRM